MYNEDVEFDKQDLIDKMEKLIKENKDMLYSKKGRFSNYILKTLKSLVFLPLFPVLLSSGAFVASNNWFGRLFGAIVVNLIVMPAYLILTALNLAVAIICLPLSLVSEIIPSAFSKKYRQECKLSVNVKRLKSYLVQLQASDILDLNKVSFYREGIEDCIYNIESLNKRLNRNQPITDYDVFDFETSNNDASNNQTTYKEQDKFTYKEQDKDL